jgi:aspartyl-tRNA(Asn)/glutamyl-tRNA(Gln) amidotransferase subunit A
MPAASWLAQPMHVLQPALAQGTLSPAAVVEELLARLASHNPALQAFLEVSTERLRAQAHALSQQPRQGKLYGVPIALKDNLCLQGELTTCASRILEGFRAPYDATVITRLKAEGALLVPRANMDEFAFGSSTENSAFGLTRNPWDASRVPGGSSGGSAAAVAADLCAGALGSDTGGSIRQPAAFCGVVGLKPTYGRVSRYGLVAFASSLDQIGPLTKDVRDAALLLSVIAGHDPRDSTSAPVAVPDYLTALERPVKGLRLGVPQLSEEGLDPQIKQAVEAAVRQFEQLGLQVERIALPHLPHAVEVYYIIATAEASSNLARYDGVQYGHRAAENRHPNALLDMYFSTRTSGFGPEARRRILLGTYVLSQGYYEAYYLKGMKVRTLIKQDFEQAFQRCDVVLMPTTPTPAFRVGEKLTDPLQMYLSDIYTISANLAGIPALSMPCGFSAESLPIGLQLLAAPFKEDVLLQAAYAYEQATEWHRRKPAISIK